MSDAVWTVDPDRMISGLADPPEITRSPRVTNTFTRTESGIRFQSISRGINDSFLMHLTPNEELNSWECSLWVAPSNMDAAQLALIVAELTLPPDRMFVVSPESSPAIQAVMQPFDGVSHDRAVAIVVTALLLMVLPRTGSARE